MTLGICADCTFWAKCGVSEAGWKIGLGKCSNVPKFQDATESSPDPEKYEFGTEVLKPDYQDVKAMTIDGGGYRADLLTMPDFGCVSYIPKV
ncbi:MAG: hypothetical protein Q8K22_13370 [Rhodoferax sp.]|jgi:hypothetical protein|nr:hypothetical protein [Rhodoferax sp.]